MLKFQLLQVQDVKEAAAIERRRQYEAERRKRIFNARTRVIGVDCETLNKQVQEKRQRDEEQKKLDELFAEQQRRDAQVALALERKEAEERRKINKEINTFRQVYQKTTDRREFDLYDPQALKKALPCRLNDDDPRLGISSAQKFEGEDLTSTARKILQIEQTKAWLAQQVNERRAAEQELKDAEDNYQAAVVSRDMRAIELDQLEKECRKKLEEALATFNATLAQEQDTKKQILKRQELEDNWAEMYNAVTGDMLTENPDVCKSNFGPNRVIGFMYKGMNKEEREEFYKAQLKQIDEQRTQREAQARLDNYWDEYMLKNDMEVAKMDLEMQMKQRELNKKMAEHNISLSKEQKAYQEYLERVVYRNKPTAAYFEQFNTTTR